jgi:hypothetical protein
MSTTWPRQPLTRWMRNACADLQWLGMPPQAVTVSHPQRTANTSYLTSLRSGWFDYAAEELQDKWWAAWLVRRLGTCACWLGLDRMILVGNWPVSTNVWDATACADIPTLCASVMSEHPNYFVGVRNLQTDKHADLMTQLRRLGFVALPARVVYEFDLRQGLTRKHSHLTRDHTARKRSGLRTVVMENISREAARRMAALYTRIYLEKHSRLNAQYTADFFEDMLNQQVMRAVALTHSNGDIMAFAMLYQVGDTLTVPALGYATDAEIDGLYRLLFSAIHEYTQTHALLLNYSSGAGDFKRKRGGMPHLEYTMVCAPCRNKIGWKAQLLRWIESKARGINTETLIALGA